MDLSVTVQFCEKKGRSLGGLRDFSKDDILYEEKPLISGQFSWNKHYRYEACGYCLRPLETAEENVRRLSGKNHIVLPHPECSIVCKSNHVYCQNCLQEVYCCQQCCDEAWAKYHSTLCSGQNVDGSTKLDILEEQWKNIHFPPETASIILLMRIIASLIAAKKSNNETLQILKGKLSMFRKVTTNEEDDISHKLLGEKYEYSLQVLNDLTKEALYDPELHEWFTPNGFRSLFALMGTNAQGIGTSAFSEWIKNIENLNLSEKEKSDVDVLIDKIYDDFDKEAGEFLDCEGTGLYELHSAINHSCDPNVEVIFPYNNHVLALRALREIKMGDEINISYLDECFLERSRHSRQKELRDNYLFNCDCNKCILQADDPDVTSEEEMSEEEMSDSDD